jgi:hypothetical protein
VTAVTVVIHPIKCSTYVGLNRHKFIGDPSIFKQQVMAGRATREGGEGSENRRHGFGILKISLDVERV